MELAEAVELFVGFDRPWFVAGGWAIDLYLGRVRRSHKDVDIAIFREDQLALQHHLASWDLLKIVDGKMEPWLRGERLDLPIMQVVLKLGSDGYAELEVLLNESTGDLWYRRNRPEVTRPKKLIGMRSEQGIPFLAPEIVLLYKSKHLHSRYAANPHHDHYQEGKINDEADFQTVRETLDEERRAWLRSAIETCYPGHPWVEQL
jgi:hypothetical protein